MGTDGHRLKALGDFIKSCRTRLTPDNVGLPSGYTRHVCVCWKSNDYSGLKKIIDDITYPAMVVNNRADVLAWNTAACDYFVDFSTLPDRERNMLWQWFANQTFRTRIANWEERSPYAVALFKGICDRYAGDPTISQLIDDLKQVSAYFAEHWTHHEVRQKSGGILEFLFSDGDSSINPYFSNTSIASMVQSQ
ncbi:MmyB family transcriptional regulator [Paenibacillus kobensis]|uniref:MmyB family transcriptional regulator n=1 Tax=Paenibacillus kobensis TaxID=59841 RepID=UPI000FDBEDB2|nr:hypothetical protein [Paenibacillus kobensis]